MDAPSLFERCEREVDELHAFFELWFTGELPETNATLERFADALADDFQLIQPSGLTKTKSGITADVFDAHATHDVVTIDTSTLEPRYVGSDTCLGTYEEWQSVGEERTGRVATVLFRAAETAPNGVEWVHLHETWLDA